MRGPVSSEKHEPIMSAILTKSLSRAVARTTQVRHMSAHGSEAEALQQMQLWTRISQGAIAFTGVFTVISFAAHFSHEHADHHDAPVYSHNKIRNKPYPWQYSDCNIFDYHCKEVAAAAAKGLAH
ncbi:hypothetical protein DYB37_006161 [Aphanomyces astaci]|uniref:Uncharacterized protein n=1 Tax=Aphanomyces astaci TaxID=112090 RepID=A0A397EXS9_APHAT|nr:hypothetical protein DYB38_007104 [Aphanomyces astaci]RHZ09020.1 hypothetical protein DYB31_005876 [Aphanomyces astaci]RHZ09228.1 hypothetical protein DYB37_006161 [Aphanomyces astaci]RLO04529.1 hypothetical protein DYB28_006491 [Aphanomyces astaci]